MDYWDEDRRFEEIDSNEDDGPGVGLDGAFVSDKLRFTGADLGRRRKEYIVSESSESSESSDERDVSDDRIGANLQLALRDKEELLVQKALERIRRAQILGRKNVKLTQPELDALERKRRKDQVLKEQAKRRVSESNLKGDQRRRISNPGRGAIRDFKPSKGKSRGYHTAYDGESSSSSTRGTPPGILVPGQSTMVGFSPLGQYSPPIIPSENSPRPNSRSGSSRSLAQPPPMVPRNKKNRYSPSPEVSQRGPGPDTQEQLRRLPDDPSWLPRPRSTSSVSGQAHLPDPFQYQTYSPPLPQIPPRYSQYSQGRRIVSSPYPDVHYPPIQSEARRRLADSSSSRKVQFTPRGSDSDGDSFSSDGDGDGVQVDVAEYGQSYDINMRQDNLSNSQAKRGRR